MTSGGLWLPLLWLAIIGSRPVSSWFGGGGAHIELADEYLDGSPFDRNVFLLLIIAGLVLLLRRRVNWGTIFASNRWLFFFFLYCGVSVIWSDYPFISFRRWIKDLGNVVMVLVIFTESDPIKATTAMFARCTYIVVPLSVVFIKYFPEFGRYYNRWTWLPGYCGVTTEKNSLGAVVFTCGLFLISDLIEIRAAGGRKTDTVDLSSRVVLLLMAVWLIDKASSSTALVCLILGSLILLCMQSDFAKRQMRHLSSYALAGTFLIVLLYSVPGILEAFVRMVGRDTTLTGRTDLWADLLREPINPLFGTGYASFWLGRRVEFYWDKWYFHPNQAHNGYLEMYLNGGLIGVCLLIGMIVSTGNNLKKQELLGGAYGRLLFSFLVVGVFYNWTEAVFNRLSPVWFILLIAALSYGCLSRSIDGWRTQPSARSTERQPGSRDQSANLGPASLPDIRPAGGPRQGT